MLEFVAQSLCVVGTSAFSECNGPVGVGLLIVWENGPDRGPSLRSRSEILASKMEKLRQFEKWTKFSGKPLDRCSQRCYGFRGFASLANASEAVKWTGMSSGNL